MGLAIALSVVDVGLNNWFKGTSFIEEAAAVVELINVFLFFLSISPCMFDGA